MGLPPRLHGESNRGLPKRGWARSGAGNQVCKLCFIIICRIAAEFMLYNLINSKSLKILGSPRPN